MGRRRKYNNSSVISIRMSDEELEEFTAMMQHLKIRRVSDMMRKVIELVKENSLAGCTPMRGAADQYPMYQNYL